MTYATPEAPMKYLTLIGGRGMAVPEDTTLLRLGSGSGPWTYLDRVGGTPWP
jgi:hypothetical protein